MARLQIFPDDVLTRSQVCFSSERQRDVLMVDLGALSHPRQITGTVDYMREQDATSPSFCQLPDSVKQTLEQAIPWFAMRYVMYPSNPYGQVFPLVVLLQAFPTHAVYMNSYNVGSSSWQGWSNFYAA